MVPAPIVRGGACAHRVRCEPTEFGPVTAPRCRAFISQPAFHRDGQQLQHRTRLEAGRLLDPWTTPLGDMAGARLRSASAFVFPHLKIRLGTFRSPP